MGGLLDTIRSFSSEIHDRIRKTIAVAKERPVHGSPSWNTHLTTSGLTPFTEEHILELLKMGPAAKTGALPVEVRQVLQKIKDDADARILELESEVDGFEHNDDPLAGPMRDALDRLKDELRYMVDTEVKNYIEATRPAPTLKGIFANAQATTPKYSELAAKAGVKSLKCPACGAPRPADQALDTCAYCGSRLL